MDAAVGLEQLFAVHRDVPALAVLQQLRMDFSQQQPQELLHNHRECLQLGTCSFGRRGRIAHRNQDRLAGGMQDKGVTGRMENLDRKIQEVESQIEATEDALKECKDKDELAHLREEKRQLREEERQLREEKLKLLEKERQLREEKLKLREEELLRLKMQCAAAGLGPGSTAADGGAWTRLEFEKLVMSSLNKIQATLTNLQLSVPIVTVTPSSCSSTQRKQIEEAVSVRFNYVTAAQAPCCCPFAKPWSPEKPPRFSWGRADVVVLPVQAIEWLAGRVLCGNINIVIKTSKTDYIFVPEAAWKDCQERFGAELFEGYKLCVTSGTTTSALLSMIDSVIALYEAKTEKALKDSLPSVRAQALLEYLAINQMKDWPTDDVIVLFGDLNRHFVVHAGRKDADAPKRSIHVAGPAPLPAVLKESPSTEADRSPLSSTLGFIRALLETSRTEEASSTGGGLGRGATRNDEGGSGSSGQGATNSRREGAHGSGGGASGSGGRGAGSDSGHSDAADAADNWAGAGSGRRHGKSGSSGADSSGGLVGGESFDGDEGILEAARDNASAQAFMSLLRLPEVYEPLGFKEPPKSFRPPTKEELLARFRPFEG
ncbi:hypothetical protein VOLCADRAFT_102614 [Volvox carteri f. nagariensis]|uniref:Uncharacterized protein n=1 Tax=Volvox carteri f. nagariensis TaxID=3068 RepID=D8TH28_VOLCA|nr:uncharacterized protein VOLCADRAFT_102614 [Volvox carteri f. nagariensis]EFJ52636.1 hypothetical protein VOLCADRAFT_102614 [Volvox carteri f. nagariensis]|eukprot:XP_002945641.1 hypothetical protein VOLCADRAFT_102614 [Volvox carteri f. nagariensis]